MAAEAQKVIPGKTSTRHGAQEMSISITRAVDSILDILSNVPPAYRLQVLKEAEKRLQPVVAEEKGLVRKVIRVSRSFKVSLPRRYAGLEGSYIIQVEGRRLIYVPKEKGDVKVRNDRGSRVIVVPLPKWAYEAIGSPMFVRLRLENGKIVIEPV